MRVVKPGDGRATGGREKLLAEIKQALKSVRGWGSIEIFVQRGRVTQITQRNIKKTDYEVGAGGEKSF